MSDIRFNRWLHQSGTGGVYQDSSGRVGIGTSVPTSALDVQSGSIKIGSNTLSSTGVSTFTTVNATTVNTTNIVGVATAGITTAYIGSVNDGPISGFRNRMINGAMEISQRGTSTANTGYLLDRWAATNTSSQSQSSDAPTGFINSIEFTSSSATYPYVEQRIERSNSYDLAGKTVTLSFWAKNVSGTSILYVEAYRANSNDNFSGLTFEASYVVSASPSASWTYYSMPLTFSANATTGIAVRIVRDNASTASTRITGVQLELGTVATPFERRSYGQELALAQRYYEKGIIGVNGLAAQYSANVYTGSNPGFGCVAIPFAVTKRAIPDVPTVTANAYWVVAGSFAVSALADHTFISSNNTANCARFVSNRIAGNSAPDAGRIYMWEGGFTWTASAEL